MIGKTFKTRSSMKAWSLVLVSLMIAFSYCGSVLAAPDKHRSANVQVNQNEQKVTEQVEGLYKLDDGDYLLFLVNTAVVFRVTRQTEFDSRDGLSISYHSVEQQVKNRIVTVEYSKSKTGEWQVDKLVLENGRMLEKVKESRKPVIFKHKDIKPNQRGE